MPSLESTFKHVKTHWKKRVKIYVNRCTDVFDAFKYGRRVDLYYLLDLVENIYALGMRGEQIHKMGVDDEQNEKVLQDIVKNLRTLARVSKELNTVSETKGLPTLDRIYVNTLTNKRPESTLTYEQVIMGIEQGTEE